MVAHPPSIEHPVSQSLEEHLYGTQEIGKHFARNQYDINIVSALTVNHDLGKSPLWVTNHLCPNCFSYQTEKGLSLCSGCAIKKPTMNTAESIYHSPYGALYVLLNAVDENGNRLFDENNLSTKEWLLYDLIGGHHGGFIDVDSDHDSINKRIVDMIADPKTQTILNGIDAFVKKAKIPIFTTKPFPYLKGSEYFDLFVKIKEYYSILCDADSLDTERHSSPSKFDIREAPVVNWANLLADLEKYIKHLSPKNNKVNGIKLNDIRNEIRAYSDNIARQSSRGCYSMEFPTGLGKTLASLSFALNLAISIAKRKETLVKRIIYVLPFLTITAQTVATFKEAFGNDVFILEHHTNAPYKQGNEDDDRKLQAIENWDYPIIVTTDVQFFESMMSAYRGQSRKIHNIADSIVILDEIQIISTAIWKPTIELMKSMTKVLNVSIVFSSATMPAFSWKGLKSESIEITSLVENKEALFNQVKRTRYKAVKNLKPMPLPYICNRIYNEKAPTLAVFNTRRSAWEAFDAIRISNSKQKKWDRVVFLSTTMCSAHRMDEINKIKDELKHNKKIVVISTQLIEAGVDLDFDVVYRKIAPLDSIIQSGGRCNREWRLPYGTVYLFDIDSDESTDPISGHYQARISIVRSLLKRKGILSLLFPYDLSKLNNYDIYTKYHEECFNKLSSDEKHIIKSLKARNYRTVSEDYKVIETLTLNVIVPYGKLTDERYEYFRNKEFITREDFRELQPNSIPLYKTDLESLEGVIVEKTVGDLRMLYQKDMYKYDPMGGLSSVLFDK